MARRFGDGPSAKAQKAIDDLRAMGVTMKRLCGNIDPDTGAKCDREHGHDGVHIGKVQTEVAWTKRSKEFDECL